MLFLSCMVSTGWSRFERTNAEHSDLMRKFTWFAVVVVLCLAGCKARSPAETPTRGRATVWCDETVWPVIRAQKSAFEERYREASVVLRPVPAGRAVQAFVNEDLRCMIVGQPLDSETVTRLMERGEESYSQALAVEGLAVIVHIVNPVEDVYVDQLADILSGATTRWSSLVDSGRLPVPADCINVMVEPAGSSVRTLLQDRVLRGRTIRGDATVLTGDSLVPSSLLVAEAVAQMPGGIGWIGTSFLSDLPDSGLFARIKILRVAASDLERPVLPIPGYLYRGDYPLRRMVYAVGREREAGPTTGFTAYLAGNEGQKRFLKLGLVPAVSPLRLVYE